MKKNYKIVSADQAVIEKKLKEFHEQNKFSTTNPNAHRPDFVKSGAPLEGFSIPCNKGQSGY